MKKVLMMIIDYSKFRGAQLNTEPFEWLVVDNIINQSFAMKVYDTFPHIAASGSFPLNSLSYKGDFSNFIKELNGPQFKQCVEEKFNTQLINNPVMITARGICSNDNGKIHIDSKGKILTFLFYFNLEWPHDGGKLRLLYNSSDMERYFVEVPPLMGTMIAFRCTSNAWHGHKPFAGVRRSIQLNYVQNRSYLFKEHLRHSVSAILKKHFKKGEN